MTYLLDSCTLLWLVSDQGKLSVPASEIILDTNQELRIHQVTSWELQIKYLLGKVSLSYPPSRGIPEAIGKFDLKYVTLQDTDIWHLAKLPSLHRDPFDRILIAHALYEGIPIITPDPQIHQYPVRCVW